MHKIMKWKRDDDEEEEKMSLYNDLNFEFWLLTSRTSRKTNVFNFFLLMVAFS
jgi:hypothetical protein